MKTSMKTFLLFQIDFLLGFSVCDKLLTHRLYIRPRVIQAGW